MRVILGSSSARRKEILHYFALPFEVASPPCDERDIAFRGDPIAYVQELALYKANSLKPRYPDAHIITADTVVFIDGEVLGKPSNVTHGYEMLSKLSGRSHSVYTGVCVTTPKMQVFQTEETKVHFVPLTPLAIHSYLQTHPCSDKAGSYAIQRSGSLLVRQIEGCYYNVMGLPVQTLQKLLFQTGINLWNYLRKDESLL
jgi:septum formation protein